MDKRDKFSDKGWPESGNVGDGESKNEVKTEGEGTVIGVVGCTNNKRGVVVPVVPVYTYKIYIHLFQRFTIQRL